MNSYWNNALTHIRNYAALCILTIALLMTSCESNKNQATEESNVGKAQDEMEVDTTESASFGGTEQSTGRADADTSGTGKANTPDTPDSLR